MPAEQSPTRLESRSVAENRSLRSGASAGRSHSFRSIDVKDGRRQFHNRGVSHQGANFATMSLADVTPTAKSAAEAARDQTVLTPVLSRSGVYPADSYHQDFFKNNKGIPVRFGSRFKACRVACGRDARGKAMWGVDAPFAGIRPAARPRYP